MPKSKPPYAPEFRAEAVRLVREHGRTITTVARELGMSQESLRLWLRRTELQDKVQTLSESEQEELRRLRKEIRVLAEEREILKKAAGLLRHGAEPSTVDIYRFVEVEKAVHSVCILSRVLKVSRSGYYAWSKRGPSRRKVEDEALIRQIVEIHKASRETYGVPRVHAALRRDRGVFCSRKRVWRLMREAGVRGISRRRP